MGKYFLHSMKNKICYWSIGSGDYSFMIQNLIYSKNLNKVEGDFIAFSDKKLKNCINQTLDPEIPLSLDNYMFKFAYLKKLIHFDYDYFVFIDADTLFVKKPNICPSFFVQDAPWHCFLESPINSNKTKRKDWWGVPINELTKMYRQLGVISNEIRNMNAGYWVCKKEFIETACNLGEECYNFFVSKNFLITEEIPMAYIGNYICGDAKFHFHEKFTDYWASDWTGIFKNKFPTYKEWEYESYMTEERIMVKPTLVHAMRSKTVLINEGKKHYGV